MAMRWLVLVLVLWAAALGAASTAQQPAPAARQAARIRVADAGPVAFVAAGGQLAVGVGQQLQFFDLNEPATPRDLVTVELAGAPLAIAASDRATLVAVSRGGAPDEIVVVAPDPYRRGEIGVVNSLQTSDSVTHILVSPDQTWAVALSRDGYVALRLSALDVIESSALVHTGSAPVAGALLNDALLLAQTDEPRIDRLPLQLSPATLPGGLALELDAPVAALVVTADGALAAAALEDDTLVLFDPTEMRKIADLTLEDGPASALLLAETAERRVLIVQIANRPAVMLLDISDPQNIGLPGSAGLGPNSVVTATAASGEWLALAGSDEIRLFQVE